MIRSWPQISDNDVIVKWPKNSGILVILGIFSILFTFLIPGLIIMYSKGLIPEEAGFVGFIFVFLLISFFGTITIGGFISAIKNHINPFIRFLANPEGLFMNITFKMKEAFFVPWNDIEKIRKTQVKRSMGGSSGTCIVDSLGVFVKLSSNCKLPKILRGVEDCTKSQINFAEDTLNTNLEELISEVNILKNKYCK